MKVKESCIESENDYVDYQTDSAQASHVRCSALRLSYLHIISDSFSAGTKTIPGGATVHT